MNNEQRFIVSCERAGEAYVRQKLSVGRYSERKTLWASQWIEQIESDRSEATGAEVSIIPLREASKWRNYFTSVPMVLLIVMLLGSAAVLLRQLIIHG